MLRHSALPIVFLSLGLPLFAQTPAPATLSTGTQLVVVDVTVEDSQGQPVRGLKANDFQVLENKVPQAIKSFDEHTASSAAHAAAALPKLPPGTFTDYTPVAPDSTLNVLLLDALNTPMSDQSFVRDQLKAFVKNAPPGTRIAIFGLTNRLIFLQGFTSDPEILKAVVERRLIPRASALLDDAVASNADPAALSAMMSSAGGSTAAIAGMQQFEAEMKTVQTEFRARYTLDAFNQIGHYLESFPGRKNLIWFSAAFPLSIFPDPALENPFSVQTDESEELRETTNLLNRARVVVYPIDARGLQTSPTFSVSRSGAGAAANPGRKAQELNTFNQANAQEHATMEQIAGDTGGRAFYNNNGLADGVAKAITSGSNFYTLTYASSNRDDNGEYRHIHVELPEHAQAFRLSYRSGYFADDSKKKVAPSLASGSKPPAAGSPAYAVAAMRRGAPAPSEILFKVRVLPGSTTTEDKVAPHNQLSPSVSPTGPFRLYDVDFAALGSEIKMTKGEDGNQHGAVEFLAFVYNADGKLLNLNGDTVKMNLTPDTYERLVKTGVGCNLQVSVPVKDETFLRLAVHDVTSGRVGVVEIPTVVVAHLPPAPPASAPPTTAPASK